MTSKEFIIWLRGFSEGVHEYNITPKQWETFKEKLGQVDDNIIPIGGVIVDNNTFKTVYPNWTGINPYGTITTTPGCSSITIANPPFGFGTTSTATSLPSGSTISYTTTNDKTLLND